MAIYKFYNNQLTAIDKTTFSLEGVLERQNLQQALKQQIDIIAPECLVIAEEFSEWSESQRRIDLLALDKQANIIVIELKRNDTGEHMELQAIRYAAMVSTMTFSQAVRTFQDYLISLNSDNDAETTILSFLGWDEPQDTFARNVKIILVSSNFSKELTTSVLWLNDKGIDIKCIRLIPYKHEGIILIDVQQIVPLPEAETYQLKIRQQTDARRDSAATTFDFTQYKFNNQVYKKRRLVLAIIQYWISQHAPHTFQDLINVFPQSLRQGGIFKPLTDAEGLKRNGIARHFLNDSELIKFSNKEVFAVSNQWGITTIQPFLQKARELGYEIEEVSYE